jgi:hypothetical protein
MLFEGWYRAHACTHTYRQWCCIYLEFRVNFSGSPDLVVCAFEVVPSTCHQRTVWQCMLTVSYDAAVGGGGGQCGAKQRRIRAASYDVMHPCSVVRRRAILLKAADATLYANLYMLIYTQSYNTRSLSHLASVNVPNFCIKFCKWPIDGTQKTNVNIRCNEIACDVI